MHTGDMKYLRQYYPNMVAVLDGFYPSLMNNETGLVEKGRRGTGGWGDYAFIRRTGPVTYYNALYVYALRLASVLAGSLSATSNDTRSHDAERWTLRADSVSTALKEHNFDHTEGLFYDGTCSRGKVYCPTHAQDGNSIAILAGVVSQETGGDPTLPTAQSILRRWGNITARDWGNAYYSNSFLAGDYGDRTYAFISYFEIAARFETGLVDSALEEMRRLWGYMASRDPGVTFWEGSDPSYNRDSFKSMAHGWSSGVVALLTRYVLGVTPEGPGFTKWKVKPREGDLSWARGVVPVPGSKEGIRVAWSRAGSGSFSLEVKVPEGLDGGIIAVPVISRPVDVRVNNEVVWGDGVVGQVSAKLVDGYVEFEAQGSEFSIVVDPAEGGEL